MKVDIATMPSEARIWVYQAGRQLNTNEVNQLEEKLSHFLDNWESHGHSLKAAWTIQHQQFLVLAVDPSYYAPSGCSIDKSVRLVQELEQELGISLLDKTKVAIEESENQIKVYALSELKQKVGAGEITKNSVIFNNLVTTVNEWKQNWKIPASESWMSRYFAN